MTGNGMDFPPLPQVTVDRREKMSWKKTGIIVAIGALLLVIGAGIGASAAILHVRRVLAPEASRTERIGNMVTVSITDDVALSTDESKKIDVLVQRHMGALERINSEYGQSIQGAFDDMCLEICEILGPQRSHAWQDAVRRNFGERAARRIMDCRQRMDAATSQSTMAFPAQDPGKSVELPED
jgi:hypothetical protein